MQPTIAISDSMLLLFALSLMIPVAINWLYQLELGRDMAWALIRMTVQLALVGLYLQQLFTLNYWWLNSLWLLVMLIVGASAIVDKAKLPKRQLLLPAICGLTLGLLPMLILMLWLVLQPEPRYGAQYMIPLAGMLLGNSLSGNIVALQRLFGALKDQQQDYQNALVLGASPAQAAQPFIRSAMQQAFAPILASMATTGLVTLPGMMTGQILGGTDPLIAVRYQWLIFIAIFVMLSVSVMLTLILASRSTFHRPGRILISEIN
nr:ABC transporter permease [Neiella marina]